MMPRKLKDQAAIAYGSAKHGVEFPAIKAANLDTLTRPSGSEFWRILPMAYDHEGGVLQHRDKNG